MSIPTHRSGPNVLIEHVTRTFDAGLVALRDLSAELASNSFTAIVGPSGCGKTTLLRILCGLDASTSGNVSVGGAAPNALRKAGRIGMAFQEPALLPWRTVGGNILFPTELNSRSAALAVNELLKLVKLAGAEDLYPAQLSGGMAQRVAVARALISQPDLLLLDEPFGSLDWFLRSRIIRDFEAVWMATTPTTVLVTHETREAVFLADRVLVMSQRPGAFVGELSISLARPRPIHVFSDDCYRRLCDQLDSMCQRGYD